MNERKVAIITGASKGIGYELAKVMAKNGYNLSLAFRNLAIKDDIIQSLSVYNIDFVITQTNVAQQAECENLIQETIKRFGRIDVLVNNAGVTLRSVFQDASMDAIKQVMDINFWGTLYSTYYAMPHLLKSKGLVVGISSIAGFKGLPTRTAYSSSKFAMEGFLDTLRTENLNTGVDVIIFRPGFTSTNIRDAAIAPVKGKNGKWDKAEAKMMEADEVAERLFKAIEKRKNNVVLTRTGKLAWWMNKLMPNLLSNLFYKHVKNEADSPLK